MNCTILQSKNNTKIICISLLPRCLNNLADPFNKDCMLYSFVFCSFNLLCFVIMCLTPRNRYEYVDKLQRNKSYPTYNAELDACDYLDLNEKIDVSNNDLFILQLNIRGMYSKLNRLKSLIEDHTEGKYSDIILLCETWHSKNSPVPEIEGYSSVHKYREHKKGGGVAILISENLNYKPRPDLELSSEVFEHCIVEVKLKTENIICCSGYRAPNTDVELFQKSMENLQKI